MRTAPAARPHNATDPRWHAGRLLEIEAEVFASAVTAGAHADSAGTNLNSATTSGFTFGWTTPSGCTIPKARLTPHSHCVPRAWPAAHHRRRDRPLHQRQRATRHRRGARAAPATGARLCARVHDTQLHGAQKSRTARASCAIPSSARIRHSSTTRGTRGTCGSRTLPARFPTACRC